MILGINSFLIENSFAKIPTSQRIVIKDSSSLNKLPNNLSNKSIIISSGTYTFSPKLIQGSNILIEGSKDSNGKYQTNLILNCSDRWFYTVDKTTDNFELRNINFIFQDTKGGILSNLELFGRVRLIQLTQNQANLASLHGGKDLYIKDCINLGFPKKYIFCNFTNQLDKLVIDQSGSLLPWKQGIEEACVRVMQVKNGYFKSLNILGSNFKQAVQDRPGGYPGNIFDIHIWEDCHIKGGLDLGNFKDKTDINFPFGQLKLSEWRNCFIDYYNTTTQGSNALNYKQMGILTINFKNCIIGNKNINQSLVK